MTVVKMKRTIYTKEFDQPSGTQSVIVRAKNVNFVKRNVDHLSW